MLYERTTHPVNSEVVEGYYGIDAVHIFPMDSHRDAERLETRLHERSRLGVLGERQGLAFQPRITEAGKDQRALIPHDNVEHHARHKQKSCGVGSRNTEGISYR